jgi:hypothetical protein
MSDKLRHRLHSVVEQVPVERLADVLCFVEMVVDQPEADLEDAWLLASGAFNFVMDDTERILVVAQE